MRIAHVCATFPPYFGGTGNACYYQARGLAERGHALTVYTAALGSSPAGLDAFKVHRLPVWFRVGNAPFLPGLMQLEGYDVIHLHYPFYFGAEMVWANASRTPYVLSYHQDVLWSGVLGLLAQLHQRVLGERILQTARRLLVTSLDYARHCRLRALPSVENLVSELPTGVDTRRFQPALDCVSLRAGYGLARGDQVVLFVGGLDRAHYFKGVDVLLRAIAKFPGRNIKLLIVGDGDLRARYERQAARLGIAANVVFCGRVSDAALPDHYALCDLLVLPSTTMGEAFGLVLLEAMACAKPVLASNLPGVRSVVSDGVDGRLARPNDADDLAEKIQSLLADPNQRGAMGERGRSKVVQRYDWRLIIPRLERIYTDALAG